MPIGFPLTPALNDEWPVVSPIWRYDGVKWVAIAGTGVSGATPITDRLPSLVATDDFIALRANVPYLVAASVVEAGPVAATAPAVFTAGQWTAAATAVAGEISFDLTALPSNGGSAITALEYRVGTGAAIAFTGTGTGVRVVTAGLTAGTPVDLQVRAVNAVGAGAWSDVKNRTPLAGGGSLEWVVSPTAYVEYSSLTAHNIAVPAGALVGDMLILALPWWAGEPPVSVLTNTGQSLAVLAQYSSASEVGSVRGVVIAGSVPTTVTVTTAAATELRAHLQLARGVVQVAGTVLDGNNIGARAALTYNTDAAAALVMSLYTTSGSDSRVLTGYTPSGGSGTIYTKWPFSVFGVATGSHSGATGANNAAATWDVVDTSGGRWISLALKP